MDLKVGCPGVKVVHPANKTIGCSWKDFYKYYYLLELPFSIPDGIYKANPNNINKKNYFLVKDNKIYPWMQQYGQDIMKDMFEICEAYSNGFMEILPIDNCGYRCSFEIIS